MDDRLQALARAWHTTGADADGAAWLAARFRAGDLDEHALALAAWLGFGPAIELLGELAPDPCFALRRAGERIPALKGLVLAEMDLSEALTGLATPAQAARWSAHAVVAAAAAWLGPQRGPGAVRALEAVQTALFGGLTPEIEGALAGLEEVGLVALGGAVQAFLRGDPDARRRLSPAFQPEGRWDHDRAPAALDPVWSAVRRALLRAALGDGLPECAPRRLVRLRLALARTPELDGELLAAAARCLAATPQPRTRPLRVSLQTNPVTLPANADRQARWGRVRTLYHRLRQQNVPCDLLVLTTSAPDELHWFATDVPDGCGAVVHLDHVAREQLRAPLPVVLAHLALCKLLAARRDPARPTRHEAPRGCAFDFCRDKVSLDARIRAGGLCAECRTDLAGRLPAETLTACERALETVRAAALAADRSGA